MPLVYILDLVCQTKAQLKQLSRSINSLGGNAAVSRDVIHFAIASLSHFLPTTTIAGSLCPAHPSGDTSATTTSLQSPCAYRKYEATS